MARQNHFMPLFPFMEPEMQKEPDYMRVFPDVVREITDYREFILTPNDFQEAKDHFIKVLDYNLAGGRRDQIIILAKMYRDLMVNKEITEENIRKVDMLGWAMELILSSSMINDDVFDKSEIRRGKRCWHKVTGLEGTAINDMVLLEDAAYILINRLFGHLPCYSGIMKTTTETYMVAMLGHSYEYQVKRVMGLEYFTMERFNSMNLMKASFQRFYLTAALAMFLTGYDLNADQKLFDAVKLISNEIGPYYQAQNDYLDCFADQSCLNKPETDIQSGQCTWFACMAMELATEQQKDIMRKCYGKSDADCVAKVKQLYIELGLQELYHDYKERNRNDVMHMIDQLLQSDEILRNACINFFSQGYEI